jgi:hypothetical protein
MDELEAAWDRLWEAIPARWTVGRPSYDPGAHAWSISAVGPHPGRGKLPISVSGQGEGEVAAILDLDARLRGERIEGPTNLEALRVRLRLSYLAGAEEWMQQELGRSLEESEFAVVINRFPERH